MRYHFDFEGTKVVANLTDGSYQLDWPRPAVRVTAMAAGAPA
jgi:hypothetical protein